MRVIVLRAREGAGNGAKPMGSAWCVDAFVVGEGARRVTNLPFHGLEAGVQPGGFRVVEIFGQEPHNFVHARDGNVVPCGVADGQEVDANCGEVWHQLLKSATVAECGEFVDTERHHVRGRGGWSRVGSVEVGDVVDALGVGG